MRNKNYDSHNLAFIPHITAPTRTTNVYVVWHSGNLVRHGKMEALISDVLYGKDTMMAGLVLGMHLI